MAQNIGRAVRLTSGTVVEDKAHALLPYRPIVAIDDLDQFRRQVLGELGLRLQSAQGWLPF